MPAPAVATQRKALALLKRHGLTRLADFRTAVSPPPRWAEWSKLASRTTRARPVPTPDAALDPHQSLAKAARLVICRASALAFHGLTDQMPPKVGRKDWCPRVAYPPPRVARFADEQLQRGVEQEKTRLA